MATGWTPQEVAALPMDFYEELIAYLNAQGREPPQWVKDQYRNRR